MNKKVLKNLLEMRQEISEIGMNLRCNDTYFPKDAGLSLRDRSFLNSFGKILGMLSNILRVYMKGLTEEQEIDLLSKLIFLEKEVVSLEKLCSTYWGEGND